VIDEAQWKTELLVTKFFLDSKKLRVWWERIGRAGFSEGYVRFIDQILQEEPATDAGFGMESRWFDESDEFIERVARLREMVGVLMSTQPPTLGAA
jgi:hypothetical protein